MTFGNGIFVYGGTAGVVGTSTDGQTWTARTSNTGNGITALTYGTVYVYAGAAGVIGSSTDAITWTVRTNNSVANLQALTYGTVYVAAGANGNVLTSTDGTTWSSENIVGTAATTFNALTYSTGTYVLAGNGGLIYTSTDANTWVSRTSNTSSSIFALAAGTNFVGVGQNGAIVNSNSFLSI
jgi:hypothetical protein